MDDRRRGLLWGVLSAVRRQAVEDFGHVFGSAVLDAAIEGAAEHRPRILAVLERSVRGAIADPGPANHRFQRVTLQLWIEVVEQLARIENRGGDLRQQLGKKTLFEARV